MWRILFTAVIAAVAACALEDERAQVDSVGFEIQSAAGNAPARDVAREAVLLVEEVAARLQERGYTPEELFAAGQAGDEQRVREMLGYTDAELAAIGARMTAIFTEMDTVEHDGSWLEPEDSVADPDGLKCDWGRAVECTYAMFGSGLGIYFSKAGWPITIAYVVGGAGICGYNNCRWERDGSGTSPGTKPKKK